VDQLPGSAEDKRRLKVIMETMTGELRLLEACRILDVSPQRFHQLREEALQGALAGLAPRPKGRPRQPPTPEQQRIAELEKELALAQLELRAAQAREEIALVLPRVVQAPPVGGKKTRRLETRQPKTRR
jgi:transposase-like protein